MVGRRLFVGAAVCDGLNALTGEAQLWALADMADSLADKDYWRLVARAYVSSGSAATYDDTGSGARAALLRELFTAQRPARESLMSPYE